MQNYIVTQLIGINKVMHRGYASSQILIASDLVRQASASLDVYLSWEGRFNQPAKTQAAYNIDTLLPLN